MRCKICGSENENLFVCNKCREGMKYIGSTGEENIKIYHPGRVIYCLSRKELILKSDIYNNYQNRCRVYLNEYENERTLK